MIFYDLHEWQHSALSPLRLAAQTTAAVFQNPFFPISYTEFGKAVAAQAEALSIAAPPVDKESFGIHTTRKNGKDVKILETEIASTPFCSILNFQKETDAAEAPVEEEPKILFIPPLSGHAACLYKSTILSLLPWTDVYLLNWRDAKDIPVLHRSFDMEDQISLIIDSLRHLGANIHVIGVGLESVTSLCAIALMSEMQDPATPLSLTLIGAAVAPQRARTTASEFARTHDVDWYKETLIQTVPAQFKGAHRNVVPGQRSLYGFLGNAPIGTDKEKEKQFKHLIKGSDELPDSNKQMYQAYQQTLDIPAEYFLQLIERIYQNDDLARGTFRWKDRLVKPEAIRNTALFAIEGDLDDVTAPGQTSAVLNLCPNVDPRKKKTHLEIGVGHYGTFYGKAWRNTILPLLLDFIKAPPSA